MNRKIEIKQKTTTSLWIKVAYSIGVLTIVGVSILFIIMNLKSEEGRADNGASMVESISLQPILWVRADDYSGTADGNQIGTWSDKTSQNNNLVQTNQNNQAKFYKNSDHINSLGLLKFDGVNDNFKINNSSDINTASNYQSKSIFMVFRTDMDIFTRQVIYEEGGNQCGLNVYIEDGFVYTGIYNKKTNPSWNVFFRADINEEEAYSLTFIYDYTDTIFKTYLNSELIDSTKLIGKLSSHSGGIGVGNVNGKTLFHTDFNSKSAYDYPFKGALSELIYYNAKVNTSEQELIENGLTSDYYLNSEGSTLPVELLDFSAEIIDGSVHLEWATATEINNDFFTIEKSLDGVTYQEIGQVQGNGNSLQKLNYDFVDDQIDSGVLYYRLKQTDFDGKYEYFGPVQVENSNGSMNVVEIVNVFPNPFTDHIIMRYNSSEYLQVTIELYDARASLVKSLSADLNEGQGEVRMDMLAELPNGNYYCVVKNGQKKLTSVKLMK
jgi:hypothetical protein